jgi:hypothetical protein
LHQALKQTGLPVEVGTGGRTKFNRCRLGMPKTHALDAACVGEVEIAEGWGVPTLAIKATGRGRYKRTRLTKHSFPRGCLMRQKQVQGFQTGSFSIQTPGGARQGISYRHCTLTQRTDGYGHRIQPNSPKEEEDRKKSCGRYRM